MKCISIYEQKMRTGKLLSVIYKNIRKNQISRKEPNKTCARLHEVSPKDGRKGLQTSK